MEEEVKQSVEQQSVVGPTLAKPKKWTDMKLLVKELKEQVVQRYLEDPLLYEGRKFDLRVFMVVSCMRPYLVLYNSGYVRLSLNQYSTTSFTKEDKCTHLTNNSVQKNHPQYKALKESSIIPVTQLV